MKFRNIKTIIAREYLTKVKKKSFLLTTFLVPVFFAAMCILPSVIMFMAKDTGKKVAVIDQSGIVMPYMIDTESVEYLKNVYPQLGNNLIHGDFLKTDLSKFASEKIGVIGNFPYNISSQIFFQVLKYRNQVDEVVGMIQKEVAERIAAGPGSKTYGILSVLLQAWYDIDYLFTVHENVFNPPPKVKSAVIRMKRNNVSQLECDEKLFVTVVKQAFNQRRKTMRNSLRSLIPQEIIQDEIFNKRPEQLSVQEFVELTKKLEQNSEL